MLGLAADEVSGALTGKQAAAAKDVADVMPATPVWISAGIVMFASSILILNYNNAPSKKNYPHRKNLPLYSCHGGYA